MDSAGQRRNVWKIGAGDTGRSYTDVFLKFSEARPSLAREIRVRGLPNNWTRCLKGASSGGSRRRQIAATCCHLAQETPAFTLYDAAKDFSPVAYANVSRLKRSALDLFTCLRRH